MNQIPQAGWPQQREPGPEELKVLDRLRGTWEVEVVSQLPEPATVTYRETYDWTLDGKYLHGETTRKSDGTQDIYMATYDTTSNSYRFWLFNSKGTEIEFSRGKWDAQTQTLTWPSGPNWDVNFQGRWTFPDQNTRKWTGRTTDWKGKVLVQLEGTARRLP
jgi:hypothetical protein